jgi:enolase-phosphatase E1
MISGYFDSTSGPRTEKDTYAKIAKEIELAPADVLYLTSQPTEATAAHAAGLKTILVVRPGNSKLADKDLETSTTISSFSELFGDEVKVPVKKVCHEHISPQKHCHATHAPKEAK